MTLFNIVCTDGNYICQHGNAFTYCNCNLLNLSVVGFMGCVVFYLLFSAINRNPVIPPAIGLIIGTTIQYSSSFINVDFGAAPSILIWSSIICLCWFMVVQFK